MSVFVLSDGSGSQVSAPQWFVAWVRLGMRLAAQGAGQAGDDQRVVAVTGPTEELAAAGIAFGYVRHRYLTRAAGTLLPDAALDQVEKGTRIWMRLPDRVRVGEFRGWDALGRFNLSGSVFKRDRVLEVRQVPAALPAMAETVMLQDVLDHQFVKLMMSQRDPFDYAMTWSPNVAIIGSPRRMTEELQVKIGPYDQSGLLGTLEQLLRPMRAAAPVGCHSLLMSSREDVPPWGCWSWEPEVSILRGAYATSRWLPELRSRTIVSVLGRAEEGIDAASTALLQAHAYGRPVTASELGWAPPPGCEVLAFDAAA